MNTIAEFVTDPPVTFILGFLAALFTAWCIRTAERRELVEAMMRRKEFEFAGRTFIACPQGMTEVEKREWAHRIGCAPHRNPTAPPPPPPPRDVRGRARPIKKTAVWDEDDGYPD